MLRNDMYELLKYLKNEIDFWNLINRHEDIAKDLNTGPAKWYLNYDDQEGSYDSKKAERIIKISRQFWKNNVYWYLLIGP